MRCGQDRATQIRAELAAMSAASETLVQEA
jgi:hypothetical protein